ncbi:MAG: hypothetical protein ACHQ4H_12300 [Ktedonobacterales bacterium]
MYEHKTTSPQAQDAKNEWHKSTPKSLSKKDLVGDQRTGSDSNESSSTRGN